MRTRALLPLLLFAIGLGAQESNTSSYGKNLLTISPFTAYGSEYVDDIFVGLTYDRFTSDFMSVGAQVAIGIEHEGYQIGIGPKFYPSGHDKTVTYGLAPTFLFTSSLANNYYDGKSNSVSGDYIYYIKEQRVNQFGFMLVNSMNATLNEQIYFSLEGGIGVNYINSFEDDKEFESGPDVSGLLRCNIGYRF